MSPKPTMLLAVAVTVKASDVDTYLAAFKPWYEQTLATPECAYFHVGRVQSTMTGAPPTVEAAAADEVTFCWLEGWTEDAKWFHEVQAAKQFFLDFNIATKPLWTKPRVVRVLGQEADFFGTK